MSLDGRLTIHCGDALETLRTMASGSVDCIVTSPPYFGLRDYGTATWEGGDEGCDHVLGMARGDVSRETPGGRGGSFRGGTVQFRDICGKCGAKRIDQQIGLEQSPDEYVARLVEVFREARRVLADTGVMFCNIGDSYAQPGNKRNGEGEARVPSQSWTGGTSQLHSQRRTVGDFRGLKPKDLIGIPWLLAFALRADGWYLRQDIIWCLSGGAWVYARTQKGDMPVMVKDLVRLDPTTVQLWNGEKWTRVLGWGRSTDESERTEIVLRSGERIGCTGGHLWPTQRGNVPTRELAVGDVIQTCTLPEPDGCARPAYLTDDVLWLAGLFIAEGSRGTNAILLSLNKDEQHWLPRIDAVARHYGGTTGCTVSGGCLNVRIWCRALDAILKTYIGGGTAKTKHLNNAAWRLPNESLAHIVQGYLDGDGHHDEPNGRYRLGFCRNYAWERDLRVLAARLGATLTLNSSFATYQNGRAEIFRGEWRWQRSGHWSQRERGEVKEVRASRARQFWDIAVEDEPHLFALASGVLTHNCKPNPMPESVTDRCTKAHETVFLLSKQARYWYDAKAVAEPSEGTAYRRAVREASTGREYSGGVGHSGRADGGKSCISSSSEIRNRRSVWTIATQPYDGAHYAVMPAALAEICIKAGCPKGGTVLDPFGGAGTTALAALRHGRKAVLIELSPENCEMARRRIEREWRVPQRQVHEPIGGLFGDVA